MTAIVTPITTIVTTEKRRLSIFGWTFRVLFWAFQAIMAFMMFVGLNADLPTATSDA